MIQPADTAASCPRGNPHRPRPRREPVRLRVHHRRLARHDPQVVEGRGQESRDDQLPHLQARAGRPLLPEDLRPGPRLRVRLRQVQAHQVQGRRLRPLRRRGDDRPRPPRAHGPHRAGRAGGAHLVPEEHAEPPRPPARHDRPLARARDLLRELHGRRPGQDARSSRASCSPTPSTARRSTSTATAPSSPRWAPRPSATPGQDGPGERPSPSCTSRCARPSRSRSRRSCPSA